MAKKIRVIVFAPDQPPVEQEIDNTLQAKQGIVGGLIQHVPLGNISDRLSGLDLYVNEEGKFEQRPPNRTLLDEAGNGFDVVVGTVFVCRDAGDGRDASVRDGDLALVEPFLGPLTMRAKRWLVEEFNYTFPTEQDGSGT